MNRDNENNIENSDIDYNDDEDTQSPCNIFIFDATKCPKKLDDFINWYRLITDWDDDKNYDDIAVAPQPLQQWYNDMIAVFKPIALAEEADYGDAERLSSFGVYSITPEAILASFAPFKEDKAYNVGLKLAQRHGVGLVCVSLDSPVVILPNFKILVDENYDEKAVKYFENMLQLDYNSYHDNYQANIDIIMAMPEDERNPDLIQQLAVDFNNTLHYQEAIDTLMLIKSTTNDKEHWLYVLAFAYHGLKRYDEAIKYAEETRALTENYDKSMDMLADAYYQIGDIGKSVEIMNIVISAVNEYIKELDDDEGYYELVTRLTSDLNNRVPYPFLTDDMLQSLADACYKTAKYKLNTGERNKAKELIADALKIAPDNSDYKAFSDICNKAVN